MAQNHPIPEHDYKVIKVNNGEQASSLSGAKVQSTPYFTVKMTVSRVAFRRERSAQNNMNTPHPSGSFLRCARQLFLQHIVLGSWLTSELI